LIELAHAGGMRAGLAGSLRAEHVSDLHALRPDIAGFRGALCNGTRTGELDPAKVRALRAALSAAGAADGSAVAARAA
jgi:uncharacterized protein (UPF0264 family)